jgi:hypothetical protein
MTKQRLNNLLLMAMTLAVAAPGISGAHAQTYMDLHDLDTSTLASPQYSGIPVQGDGNLYGTTPSVGRYSDVRTPRSNFEGEKKWEN